MGMKVAAVSTLCQDARVFDAMMMAGTPCPYKGKIGKDAFEAWKNNPDDMPEGATALITSDEVVEKKEEPFFKPMDPSDDPWQQDDHE